MGRNSTGRYQKRVLKKLKERADVTLAAAAIALGMDGLKLLEITDPCQLIVADEVVTQALEIKRGEDRRLAIAIVENINELFKG